MPFALQRRVDSAALHVAGLSILAIAAATATGLFVELVYGDDQWPALAIATSGLGVIGGVLWRGTSLPDNAGGALSLIHI